MSTARDTAPTLLLGPMGKLQRQSSPGVLGPLGLSTCTMPTPPETTACLPHPHKKAEARTESQCSRLRVGLGQVGTRKAGG